MRRGSKVLLLKNFTKNIKLLVLMILMPISLSSCSSQSIVNSKSLTQNDVEFCSYIEDSDNFTGFRYLDGWIRFSKDRYISMSLRPDHSALKFIDSEIRNFDFDPRYPEMTFKSFMGQLSYWQDRCRRIMLDPNN